jgi:hypothetical protein
MTVSMPWGDFSSQRLDTGWRYPVRRTELAVILERYGAWVDSVNLRPNTPEGKNMGLAIVADVSGTSGAGYFGSPNRKNWTSLSISAVAGQPDAGLARDQLFDAELDRAAQWLAAVPARGNAWLASAHSLHISRSGSTFVSKET